MITVEQRQQMLRGLYTEIYLVADAAGVRGELGPFADALQHAIRTQPIQGDPAPPLPPPSDAIQVPEWGAIPGDSEGKNRHTRLAQGQVYTMLVHANGRTVVGSGALVPGGSGSMDGKLSGTKGDLGGWDGTGGGADATMYDRMERAQGDVWFTFRLGAEQADSDANVLIQFFD